MVWGILPGRRAMEDAILQTPPKPPENGGGYRNSLYIGGVIPVDGIVHTTISNSVSMHTRNVIAKPLAFAL